jgi:hypothetical protein
LSVRLTATLFVLLACAAQASAQAVQSVYSDLSEAKCKVVKSGDESEGESSSVSRCPGIAGYNLLVLDGDSRQSVTIVRPNGTEHPLDLWHTVSGAFSTVGQRAEWRVRRRGDKDEPFALIVRFTHNALPDNPDKKISTLVVAKITTDAVCVTDAIPPAPDANERARKAADSSASKPCRGGE